MSKDISLTPPPTPYYYPLCYRCEHRARYYETKSGPRCECGLVDMAVGSCYMYDPVMPVMLKKNDGDSRPMFAGRMLSARSHGVRLPVPGEFKEVRIVSHRFKDGYILCYEPEVTKKIAMKVNGKMTSKVTSKPKGKKHAISKTKI